MVNEIIKKIRGFLKETYLELKKVIWPDQKYIVTATVIIFVIVILIGLFLMVVDFGFSEIFAFLMRNFSGGGR